jgi:hypothetical protein
LLTSAVTVAVPLPKDTEETPEEDETPLVPFVDQEPE